MLEKASTIGTTVIKHLELRTRPVEIPRCDPKSHPRGKPGKDFETSLCTE